MIEDDFQVLLQVLRGLASRLIMAANHLACRAQPGARCGFAHHGDHGVKRVEPQALARSREMRQETTLKQMVLRTRARGVSHTHSPPPLLSPKWQSILAERGMARVAAATVAPP